MISSTNRSTLDQQSHVNLHIFSYVIVLLPYYFIFPTLYFNYYLIPMDPRRLLDCPENCRDPPLQFYKLTTERRHGLQRTCRL